MLSSDDKEIDGVLEIPINNSSIQSYSQAGSQAWFTQFSKRAKIQIILVSFIASLLAALSGMIKQHQFVKFI